MANNRKPEAVRQTAPDPSIVTGELLQCLLMEIGVELEASAKTIAEWTDNIDGYEYVRPHVARIISLGETLCEMAETSPGHALSIGGALKRVRMVDHDESEQSGGNDA